MSRNRGVPFTRYEPMPASAFSMGQRLQDDPDDWTPDTFLTAGTATRFKRSLSVSHLREVRGLRLHPFTRDRVPHPLHLPVTEMLGQQTVPWASADFIPGGLVRMPFLVDWVRVILQTEVDALSKVGIYEAVFLSLFEYTWDPFFFQSMVERWNYVSNTVVMEDCELTISLAEMRHLTGLPIFGVPYDEYLPLEGTLSELLPDGSRRHPISLQRVFDVYHELSYAGEVDFRRWIAYFSDAIRYPVHVFAHPYDPFGTGREEIFHTDERFTPVSASRERLGAEAYLTAFLAWWLCCFVIPSQPAGVIRPDCFIMANNLARGEAVSLAIPALANVFRCMRILSTSKDPSHCDEVVPFHFLMGWAHIYWPGLYTPSMSERMRADLPLLAGIAGVRHTPLTPRLARDYFSRSRGFLRSPESWATFRRNSRGEDLELLDRIWSERCPEGLKRGSRRLDFLVSLRHGLLPLRLGDRVILEPYMPHRCARQFGFDQDIPAMVWTGSLMAADLAGAARCWESILRTDTRVSFTIPSTSRVGVFSAAYQKWFYDMVQSCQVSDKDLVLEMVRTRRKSLLKRRQVPFLERAPDLQSRDSRLSPPGVDSSAISRAVASSMPEQVVRCDVPARVFLRPDSGPKRCNRKQKKRRKEELPSVQMTGHSGPDSVTAGSSSIGAGGVLDCPHDVPVVVEPCSAIVPFVPPAFRHFHLG
ncbi:Plant mobile domain-containing protein [Carex littledalei]|uniref:Plant mobile domain-containing protein n=1 Tax=Carex littledalei TaxID=544730 RepID=A0A833QP92_9POAL|nr:Plant mobile domain-containing protein [Carex littledalei]